MTEEEKKKQQGVSNDNDNQEIHTSVKDWQGNEHKIDYTPETGAVITPPKANENENANDNLNPNDNLNDNTPDEIDLRAEEQNAEAEQRWKEARERVESLFKPTESEDERKKREKREKAVRIAAGISDMVSALANLHFTGRYAPNAYTGKPTLSEAAKKRYDIAKAEREKDKNYNDRLQLALNTLDKDLMTTKLNIEKGRQAAKDRKAAREQQAAEKEKDRKAQKEIADANRKSKEDEGQKNREAALKRARMAASRRTTATSNGGSYPSISAGINDNGTDAGAYDIPKVVIEKNIGKVWATVPEEIKNIYVGAYGLKGVPKDIMIAVVEEFLANTAYTDSQKYAARTALYNLAHPTPAGKPTQTKTNKAGRKPQGW